MVDKTCACAISYSHRCILKYQSSIFFNLSSKMRFQFREMVYFSINLLTYPLIIL